MSQSRGSKNTHEKARPQCRGIKRASKEPNEGLRKSRGIGARNPCRIEYMGVYEILILPGGSKNARSRWRLLRRKTNQLLTKEEGRVVKPPPFFAPHSLPFPVRLPTRIQIDLSYRASVRPTPVGRAEAARVIDHSRRRPPDACVHIAMGTDHTRRQAQNTHRPRPTTQQRRGEKNFNYRD